MFKSVSKHDFERSFVDCGRKDSFSYRAQRALFEYLEEMEEDIGEPIELDAVALCCAYSEYETAKEAVEAYEADDNPDNEQKCLEYLQDQTTVIEFDGGIVIQDF